MCIQASLMHFEDRHRTTNPTSATTSSRSRSHCIYIYHFADIRWRRILPPPWHHKICTIEERQDRVWVNQGIVYILSRFMLVAIPMTHHFTRLILHQTICLPQHVIMTVVGSPLCCLVIATYSLRVLDRQLLGRSLARVCSVSRR